MQNWHFDLGKPVQDSLAVPVQKKILDFHRSCTTTKEKSVLGNLNLTKLMMGYWSWTALKGVPSEENSCLAEGLGP